MPTRPDSPPQPFAARLVICRREIGAPERETPFEGYWELEEGHLSEPFPLTLPLSAADTENLRWYLEGYYRFVGAGTRKRAENIAKKLPEWGRRLFDALFETRRGAKVYADIVRALEARRPVYLTLGTSESAALAQPWELMHDQRGPLALRGVSIRRQLEAEAIDRPAELSLPLRVLLIVSRPEDSGFIDPRSSVRPVLDALDDLPTGSVELDLCEPPTFSELKTRIGRARAASRPFHIVHFDGHGNFLPESGTGVLCFENRVRLSDSITGQSLGDTLAELEIPLVMLEACRTSDLSDQPIFGSVAPALLSSGVGSVVAFSHSVHVEAARLLVQRFYRALAEGQSVGAALAAARGELAAKPERWLIPGPDAPTVDLEDWFIAQLYQAGPDPALVREGTPLTLQPSLASKSARSEAIRRHMHGFPPEPQYGFRGRAWELLEMERTLGRHPTLVLAGGGGMGKTALAREAATWWLRTGRFDEAVFYSFEQTPSVDRAVVTLGRALEGLDFSKRPADTHMEAAVELFRARKVLWIWDNFESTLPQFQDRSEDLLAFDEEECRRLRAFFGALVQSKAGANPPEGRLLVTCRPTDTGLQAIAQFRLGGLARSDSLHLLAAIARERSVELERSGCEPEEVERLLDALQDHPLSIALVGPHLAKLTPQEIREDFAAHLDLFTHPSADVDRNTSLRASLAFSTRRLSEEARDLLPWLAWFRGGAFEKHIRVVAGLAPETWRRLRQELEATALVRVEKSSAFDSPFIRFHPTLAWVARSDEVPDVEQAEERFISVYLKICLDERLALGGLAAAAVVELMAREEANLCSAIGLAFTRGGRQTGMVMASTLRAFFEKSDQRRNRYWLAAWMQKQMPEQGLLDEAACIGIRSGAEALFEQGQREQALKQLHDLVERLESEGLAEVEPTRFQLGSTYWDLGRLLVDARQPAVALGAIEQAIRVLEQESGFAAKSNYASALGSRAHALVDLGRYKEALETVDRALEVAVGLGLQSIVADQYGIRAKISSLRGLNTEADEWYGKTAGLARRMGDLNQEAATLQHRGLLSWRQGDLERSVELYERAVRAFHRAGNQGALMRTYDLLGSSERDRGHLDVAEAWYSSSRALAAELGDQAMLGANAQNVGILFQKRAEEAASGQDRQRWLYRAVGSLEESLAIWIERGDELLAAFSYGQLGQLHRILGDLDRAEELLLEGLAITEPLDHPDVWKDYGDLSKIAEARGDSIAAAEWAAKRDAKLSELRRLAAGQEGG